MNPLFDFRPYIGNTPFFLTANTIAIIFYENIWLYSLNITKC